MKQVKWISSGSSSFGLRHEEWTVEQVCSFLKKFTTSKGTYKYIGSVMFALQHVAACYAEPWTVTEALEKAGYDIIKPKNVENPKDYKVKISLSNVYEIEGVQEKVRSLRILRPLDGCYSEWERKCVKAITKQTNNWYLEKGIYMIAWDCIADEILNELGYILPSK